jgi:hypothetical protein
MTNWGYRGKGSENPWFDIGQPLLKKTIGATYSPIKNRDYVAERKVIASGRFVMYLKPRAPQEADSRYAPAKVGHGVKWTADTQ